VNDDSRQLVQRWKDGDDSAADEIFERYLTRLIGLARSRLSPALARRVDAEDIVQSAYHTFFRNAREDRYVFERSGDLWRLLVGITMKKLHRNIEFHTAAKRSFRAEDSIRLSGESVRLRLEAVDSGPSPAEALSLVEQLDRVLESMDESHRDVFRRRLRGESVEEIATEIHRSQRTVRRLLERVRSDLEHELLADVDAQ
jgi:RNA polymerase sigma-70 factor (ECF subfamily)